jgi:hypothetical protein
MEEKKEYQLVTSVNEGILEIIITGELPINAVDKQLDEINAIAKTKNVGLMLIDVRSEKGRIGLGESYFRLRETPANLSRMKIAIIDIEENAVLQSFQEITAKNASLLLKWFTDIDEARNWLKGKH